MNKQDKYDPEWAEAKRRCRLNQEDIRMAKQLGFRPRSLIKNIPGKNQQWKAPVRDWIRDLYEKHQSKIGREESSKRSRPSFKTGASINAPRRSKSARDYEAEPESLDEEQWERLLETTPVEPTEQELEILMADGVDERAPLTPQEIEQENILKLRRQKHFRMAAEYVAHEFSKFHWVEKVALFGSVARPLKKEVPRIYRYRRAGIQTWHECKDVDVAVWVSELGNLNALRKARTRAVNELLKDTGGFVGVAHHQVDVFILEPGTDRYLGTLCIFNECPKSKPECEVKDCGIYPFLQQHVGFRLRTDALTDDRTVVLFSRKPAARYDDEIPF